MKKWQKWFLWSTIGLVGLIVITIWCLFGFIMGSSTNSSDNRDPAKQAEMLKLTLAWGNLAPIPKGAKDFTIYTAGTSFSRSFFSSFTADKPEIAKWITASPGLRNARTELMADGGKKYLISPQCGAGFAEVIIHAKTGRVDIYVCWS